MTLEPAAVVNASVTIIETAIALAVGPGLSRTAEQVDFLRAGVVATYDIIKTIWVRG